MNLTDADREQHYPTTPVQCACGWRQTDPDAGTWLDHMGAAAVQATTERVRRLPPLWRKRYGDSHASYFEGLDRAADDLDAALDCTDPA